jgi:cytochrome P450
MFGNSDPVLGPWQWDNQEQGIIFSQQHNAWFVRGLREAREILLSDLFSTEAYKQFGPDFGQGDRMLTASGESHARLRRLFSKHLSMRANTLRETVLLPAANSSVPRILPDDPALLLKRFVYPYLRRSIYGIIGIDADQGDEIVASIKVASRFLEQRGSENQESKAALDILADRVTYIYGQSRNNNGTISLIKNDNEDRSSITNAIHLTLPLLRTLALDVERDLTWTLIQYLLALEPTRRDKILLAPGNLFRACDEVIRLEQGRFIPRTAIDDVQLGGVIVPKGSLVIVLLSAIGSDFREFEKPCIFNENRPNIDTYPGFGLGQHRCAGETLAKIIASTAAEVLFEKLRSARSAY